MHRARPNVRVHAVFTHTYTTDLMKVLSYSKTRLVFRLRN